MLKNLIQKLKNKKDITIAYFGGSITQGAGASAWNKYSWRALITQWFKDNYPNNNFIEIDASFGGTGSDCGSYRLNDDVLIYHPDLLFVEFCVNDTVVKNPEIFEENIIRRVLEFDSTIEIVMLRTLKKEMCYDILGTKPHDCYLMYDKLSKYYDIPLIDIGKEFSKDLNGDINNIYKFTDDGVHPNDYGYSIYANRIIEFLKDNLNLPNLLTTDKYKYSSVIWAKDIITSKMKYDDTLVYKNRGCLIGQEETQNIELVIKCHTLGIIVRIANDSGILKWKLDDGEYNVLDTWDEYALKFNRNSFVTLMKDMPLKEHRLTIIPTGEKNEKSNDNLIRIIGIFYA